MKKRYWQIPLLLCACIALAVATSIGFSYRKPHMSLQDQVKVQHVTNHTTTKH